MTEQTGVMSQIDNNIAVGMGEVVNVFMARYENRLHAERTVAQEETRRLNNRIQELLEVATERFKLFCEETDCGSFSTEFVTITNRFRKDFTVHMDKGHFQVRMETLVESNICDKNDHYRSNVTVVNVNVPISADLIRDYKNLMTQKSDQTDILARVNADLRDIGRKERQIRGRIAEMKLKDLGMEDLLAEPTLLTLIDESGI